MSFDYTLIKSSRKTISISITSHAQVVVRAPNKLSEDKINKYISENHNWIQKNLKSALEKKQQSHYATFENGSCLYFLGQKIPVEHVFLKNKAIEVTDKIYINEKYSRNAKKIIIAWFQRIALSTVERRIKEISNLHGLVVTKIRISNAQTRWGSCSGKDSISISWRLIMAPPDVLDYVIYHELAHVTHKNHSKSFWKQVESFDKNYKKSEKWLKDNGHLLSAV
jgi:predicted metal-dependent hydrolase